MDNNTQTNSHTEQVTRSAPSTNNITQKKTEDSQLDSHAWHNKVDDQKEIGNYFMKMLTKHHNKNAEAIEEMAEQVVFEAIKNGEVFLSKQQRSVDEILHQSRLKEENTKRQQGEEMKKKQIQMQLKYLNMQTSAGKKNADDTQSNQFSYRGVLSKKEHQQFLEKISKQRSQLSLRKKQVQEKQRIRLQEEAKLKKMALEQRMMKEKQDKKKKILQKIEQQKVRQEQKLKQEEENNRKLSEIKQKKFLHQKIEQKYATQVLIPTLQQKKRKLKQIRQMSKAFNVQQIKSHEKQYLKKRAEVMSASQARNARQDWHYKAPEKVQRLAKLIEQQSLQEKLKLQEKKRKLEQKIQRQEQFMNYLKQKHIPTIDPKKREQIQQRLRLKSEEKEQKLDGKTLGLNYLQEAKQHRKRSANSQMQLDRKPAVISQEQARKTKKAMTNYLIPRKSKEQYNEMREKRIQKLIKSQNIDRAEAIVKLQLQANKLLEEQKRKEEKLKYRKNNKQDAIQQQEDTTNLLLASIKAKMGIIDLYNKE